LDLCFQEIPFQLLSRLLKVINLINGWERSSSFEPNITIFGTENHHLTASLVETPELSDQVEVYNGPRIDPNPIFAVRLGAKSCIVINKQGEIVTEYEFEKNLGNDIEMLPNGEFLGMFKPNNRKDFSFGGSGGVLRRITAD